MLDTSTLKLSHSTSESHSKLNYENMQRFLAGLPQLFEKAEEEWWTAEGEGDDFVEGEGNGLGEGDALCALGGMFEDGLVVVVDVQAAFDIYQRLSSRGHSTALCGVGWFYDLGGGVVEPDKQRAFHYYQLASDKVTTRSAPFSDHDLFLLLFRETCQPKGTWLFFIRMRASRKPILGKELNSMKIS